MVTYGFICIVFCYQYFTYLSLLFEKKIPKTNKYYSERQENPAASLLSKKLSRTVCITYFFIIAVTVSVY